MPFPDDETIMKTSAELVEALQNIFGKYPGIRPAHAKGLLLHGTFTPTPTASTLSIAHHFTAPSTPLLIRFSNSTGIPTIPDTDPNADPRGLAIRFNYPNSPDGKRVHTDLIAHSVPLFPVRTGAEFLAFLRAVATSPPDAPHPNAVEQFVGANPSALKFVTTPKPAPKSFATQQYWGVTAFKLIDAAGKETFVRYSVVPDAGVQTLSAEETAAKGPEFLQEEIKERVAGGKIGFKLVAQVAGAGDVTDDATVHWPEEREVVELGSVVVEGLVDDGDAVQKTTIFDPIPRVPGVGPSEDPLLEMRAALYLISGKQRRAA